MSPESPLSPSRPENVEVTVIIPVFNGAEQGIQKTVESVLSQRNVKLRLTLVDDGSTDDSIRICRKFESLDPRISLVSHPANRGLSASLNDGIRVATTPFVCILQQDCSLADEDVLGTGLGILQSDPRVGVLVGYESRPDNGWNKWQWISECRLSHLPLGKFGTGLRRVGQSENKCDLMRMDVLVQVGPFDTELRTSGEDQVFSRKVLSLGLTLANASGFHFRGTHAGEDSFRKVCRREWRYGTYVLQTMSRRSRIRTGAKSDIPGTKDRERATTIAWPMASAVIILAAILIHDVWLASLLAAPVIARIIVVRLKHIRHLSGAPAFVTGAWYYAVTILLDLLYSVGVVAGLSRLFAGSSGRQPR